MIDKKMSVKLQFNRRARWEMAGAILASYVYLAARVEERAYKNIEEICIFFS